MIDLATDGYELILSFPTLSAEEKHNLKKMFDAQLPFLENWQQCKSYIHKQADNMRLGIDEPVKAAMDFGSWENVEAKDA